MNSKLLKPSIELNSQIHSQRLWNKVLRLEDKNILSENIFKKKTKERIFLLQNEINFFIHVCVCVCVYLSGYF